MNILERKANIAAKQSIADLLGRSLIIEDINDYLKNFIRPPIYSYIPNTVINQLYQISCDYKLANNPKKRFDLQNDILAPYRFKPLASGTSRRAFYCTYDPNIIIKLGSDMIGRSDNISEYSMQHILSPLCTKILDVDPTGSVMLAERVDVMTENDYKDWVEDIFLFIESFYRIGYIFEDIGLYSFKNWGIRLGFGPVLLDFPYIYQVDWDKMICNRIDSTTHKKCGGIIGYNYESVLSEIICHKCHARYSAQYLAKQQFTGQMLEKLLGRKKTMFTNQRNIKVAVARGNQIVFDPDAPKKPNKNTQPQPLEYQIQQNPTPIVPDPRGTGYTVNETNQPTYIIQKPDNFANPIPPFISNDQFYFRFNPERLDISQRIELLQKSPIWEKLSPVDRPSVRDNGYDLHAKLSSIESIFANSLPYTLPDYKLKTAPPTIPVQQPKIVTQQTPSIETAKDYEAYVKDGRKYIFYPKPLKNDLIQTVKNIEKNYGTDIALLISSKLEIEYIPQSQWQNTRKSEIAVQKPFPTTIQQTPPPPPTPAQPAQFNYPTINTMNRMNRVQTVIAPATKPVSLKVENTDYWSTIKQNEIQMPNVPVNVEEPHPTSNLEILKPMTPEEIEAQEFKSRHETGILGYPGVPVVDTARAKEAIPRIKAMVEARFNNFILDNDSEKQSFMLSQGITRFISEDMKHIMNDDGKGLLVIATRSVDTHNKDCFNIRVLNYNAFIFSAVLYPMEDSPTQQIMPVKEEESEMTVPIDELTAFFEENTKTFNASQYKTKEEVKRALIEYLYKKASSIFKGRITVPCAMKEATAYVNQVVNIKESNSAPAPKENTVAGAL